MNELLKELERVLEETKMMHKNWITETENDFCFDDYYEDGVFSGQIETLEFVIAKIKRVTK